MTINQLPVKTWNHLRMNGAEFDSELLLQNAEPYEELPAEIYKEKRDTFSAEKLRTGLGTELSALLSDSQLPVNAYRVDAGVKIDTPVYQDFHYDTGVNSANIIELTAPEGSRFTVIQYFTDKGDLTERTALVQNRCRVEKDAELTLIQVQTLSDQTTFLNDIGTECEEGGHFRLIQLVLGGKKTYLGAFASLSGRKSAFASDLAYRLSGSERLDVNLVADHTGERSESEINVSGVLSEQAFKLFRGTIDFHRGCAGAKGAELEDVLLLDEGIVNQTIPLILCDEEDVEGSHGASIGRIDDSLLFYLKSRGISEEEIYRMMARAKIDLVANKITDEKTRTRIGEYLDL